MAKIVVAGNAVVITSSLKLEEIKTIKKYRPEALTLMGGKEESEPVFMLDSGEGGGSINSYGAVFTSATHDDNKYAVMTILQDFGDKDPKEVVADTFGAWVMTLNKLEAQLPAVLEEIEEEKARILENIEIAQ